MSALKDGKLVDFPTLEGQHDSSLFIWLISSLVLTPPLLCGIVCCCVENGKVKKGRGGGGWRTKRMKRKEKGHDGEEGE